MAEEHKAFDKARMSRFWGKVKTYVASAISGLYTKPSGGIPKSDLSSDVQTSLGKADTALQSHQDISGKQDVISDLATIRSGAALGATALQSHQDISGKQDVISDLATIRSGASAGATALQPTDIADWAKQPTRPSYTANDTSSLPDDTTLADLPTDENHRTVTDAEKAAWDAKLSAETDPTVPAWAKEATKPTYTADEVGALPSNTNVNNAYNIAMYYSYKLKTACGRYMILVTYDEEYILPVTAENNNTGTDKVMTDLSFDPFGQVYYYHATSNKSADSTFPNGGNPVLFTQYNLTSHLAYSFNMSSNPVARKAFYLVMSPQSDGRCKLHSTPFTQTLPTAEDGLVYKYLGMVSSSDNLLLAQDKPCYYFKDGKLRLWTGG